MPNRLARESSPYLRQHAENPVDWYPWGDEAFAKARAESKPIFLSVGYSTCHWCHVMAHESFENEAVARVLNSNFVPVKVDREERPDVDRVYMLFVQATTGSGGWPMSVWLTPELQPFYGGTYFPPASQWGRPGFLDILDEIRRVWGDDPGKVRQSAAQLTRQISEFASARRSQPGALVGSDAGPILDHAVAEFEQSFDRVRGGFGGAPKFPRPTELLFLLREFARTGRQPALDMVTKTLGAMARGGIHDHLGGGFHRYSVDARWHVPHFEKMLYDQAQLALAYLEAFQATHDEDLAHVASRILEYVGRDLARQGGGFFSAEDADSVPPERAGDEHAHAVEGAFYAWSAQDIERVTGDDAAIVAARFGVQPGGNVESDPHGGFENKNVLYLAGSLEQIAADAHIAAGEVKDRLSAARERLFAARAARPRPGLDDKVIVSWNGLMIAAFARAARVLGQVADYRTAAARWLQHARSAASFIRETLWNGQTRTLLRRYREGDAGIDAYAEDYAYLIFGLLELFQADGHPEWLDWALALQRRQDELFRDEAGGGWFSTTGTDASVLVRLKDDYDGAEPSASSVSLMNLLAFSRLTGGEEVAARIDRTLAGFVQQLRGAPRAVPMMLAALSTSISVKREIVIVGPPGRADTQALLSVVAAVYLPAAVTVPMAPEERPEFAGLLPFVSEMDMVDGRATAYVCRDFACARPTASPAELLEEISRRGIE
jgi:uncharacterized protein